MEEKVSRSTFKYLSTLTTRHATRDAIKPPESAPGYNYPLLAPIAMDILSIPASSAAVDSGFYCR